MSLHENMYSRKVVNLALALYMIALVALLFVGIARGLFVLVMLAGCGFAIGIIAGSTNNFTSDHSRSEATERTLRVASNTFEHLGGGLTRQNAHIICKLLLPETDAAGIALTDTLEVLAAEGSVDESYAFGPNTKPTLEVLSSKRTETFIAMDADSQEVRHFIWGNSSHNQPLGIIVPLLVHDRSVGTIKLYYSSSNYINRTQLGIAEGLGTLLSTQLSSYELDRQAELTARAEVKALQAQINPHFLFNTLNTIASFTRTDPTKARDLLREFSRFYRRTLENSEKTLIPFSQELEQTRRYLAIEKARFGEERILETERVEPGCEDLPVPSFLVQPIVENAVRHAMRDEGTLHIDVQATTDKDDILIAVTDDGLGMDAEAKNRLLAGSGASQSEETKDANSQGTGMALHNVEERIKRFFGAGSNVEIVSRAGEGTCVTLRLVNARDMLPETTH